MLAGKAVNAKRPEHRFRPFAGNWCVTKVRGSNESSPSRTRTKNRAVNTTVQKCRVFEGFFLHQMASLVHKKPFLCPIGIPAKSNRVSRLSFEQTSEDCMAEPAVLRPALALHAAIEFRFDPASPVRTRRHGPRPSQGGQPFFQFDSLGSREASG